MIKDIVVNLTIGVERDVRRITPSPWPAYSRRILSASPSFTIPRSVRTLLSEFQRNLSTPSAPQKNI